MRRGVRSTPKSDRFLAFQMYWSSIGIPSAAMLFHEEDLQRSLRAGSHRFLKPELELKG